MLFRKSLRYHRVYMVHLLLVQSTIRGNESRGHNEDATDVHHTLDAIAHYAAQSALGSVGAGQIITLYFVLCVRPEPTLSLSSWEMTAVHVANNPCYFQQRRGNSSDIIASTCKIEIPASYSSLLLSLKALGAAV